MKIVCPSHHRAHTLKTPGAVADVLVVVEESQAAEYREANPGVEIETHPDSVRGISAKRQWMYERWGDIFMLDDDITSVMFMGTETGKPEKVDPVEARDRIVDLHSVAEAAGVYLYGWGIMPNPMYYVPQDPFRLTGNIHGGAFGMRPSPNLYFHPDLVVFDDMWVSAINAYYHRLILVDTRYQVATAPMTVNPGGMAHERNTTTTRDSRALLVENFGDVLKDSKVSEAMITLRVPW